VSSALLAEPAVAGPRREAMGSLIEAGSDVVRGPDQTCCKGLELLRVTCPWQYDGEPIIE